MKAAQDAFDGAQGPPGADHEMRPAGRGAHAPVRFGRGLECAHRGGADGDHAAAERAREVDARGARLGDLEALRVGRLTALERRHACVQEDRHHVDAARHQARDRLRREGPARARHLGAAGLVRIDVLVGAERPVAGRVAVADRAPVGLEVLDQVTTAEPQVGHPEPRAEMTGEQLHLAAGGELQALAGVAAAPAPVARSQLDDPSSRLLAGRGRREVKEHAGAAGRAGRQRRGQRAGGVHDEDVGRAEQLGQLVEVAVMERAVRGVRDEHQHAVPADAPLLRRPLGLAQLGRRRGRDDHAASSTSSAAR